MIEFPHKILLKKELAMERDMDLIRRIALETAAMPHDGQITGLDGVNPDTFALHVEWMVEANLIKATITEFVSGPTRVFIHRLTWDGCEFVDSVRSETLWNKAKSTVLKPAGSFTFTLLREWLSKELQDGLPTLRG